jgi:mannose-6-phosphate isomerase-like protein (cupin superfamily)
MAAPDTVVNLDEKFALFSDRWAPKTVGEVNDLQIKLVRTLGEFDWHSHEETDEFFLVLRGRLTIQLRGRDPAVLGPGEFFVVPRGLEHRPVATEECALLLLEPAGTVNTGDATDSALTATEEWI